MNILYFLQGILRSGLLCVLFLVLTQATSSRGAQLRSLQSDVSTLAAGNTSLQVTIDPVVTNEAFLVFGVSGSSVDVQDLQVSGQLSASNQLDFARDGTNGNVDIQWYVAEFRSGVNVQRGSASFAAANPTSIVTLTSVNLSNSFPLVTYRTDGTGASYDDFVRARLTSPTNLVLSVLDPTPAQPNAVEWQVVEYTDATVRTGDVTLANTALSTNVIVSPSFTTGKSWLVYSYENNRAFASPNTLGDMVLRGQLSGTNTLTFDRGVQRTNIMNISYSLIEFNDGTIVQDGNAAFGAGELSKTVTIDHSDPNCSVALGGFYSRGGQTPHIVGNDDDLGIVEFNFDVTDNTTLEITRGSTGTVSGATADVGWFAMEFDTIKVRGVVWEDVNGDADLSDAVGRSNVTMSLYSDDGDNVPDAGDTLLQTVSTGPTGYYSFVLSPSNTYWVTADSLTVSPSAGYNTGYGLSNVWAEQTYGAADSAAFDGTNFTFTTTNGTFYGGKQDIVSDDATTLTNAEHIVRVAVTNDSRSGVDFGFSFNVIVNTNDLIGATTNSLSQGSLRKFIENANAISGVNTSEFAIAGTGVKTIYPLEFLGFIEDPVVLDATTQSGYSGDPIIELDGGALLSFATAGLVLRTSDSVIRGFIVHSFSDEGLEIDASGGPTGSADRNILQNNWVGIDETGAAKPNLDHGILLTDVTYDNVIGGTNGNDGNVISGNADSGIHIREAYGTVVIGNQIGVAPDGVTAVSNGTHGVWILNTLSSSNRIGGLTAAEANVIAYNGGDGVRLDANAGVSNTILGNLIFENGGLGIDLNADGVTANDTGDGDTGPNKLQNYPTNIAALVLSTNSVQIYGTLNSATSTTYRVEFFANTTPDPSGHGEGERFLGFANLTTDSGGNVTFTQTFSAAVSAGEGISATATDPDGNTSEFSSDFEIFDACDICYLVADSGGGAGGDDQLTRFDKATGGESAVGAGTGTFSIEAIAYDPFGTNLYAANSSQLGTISLLSGTYSAIGSFGTGTGAFGTVIIDDVDGLSLDPFTQVLYGVERTSTNDLLVAIDVTTGSIISNFFGAGLDYVVISAVSNLFDIDDIAIDAYDGQLYGVANNGASDRLVTINKATGAAADVGSLGVGDMEGMGFDNSGSLFGTTGGGATVYDISKTNGVASNPRALTVGGDYEAADCLTCEPNTITGTVFFDADESATFNVGDTGQSNAIVRLYRDVNTNGVLDLGTDILVTTNVTDSSGAYQFTFASTGQFVLDIDTNSIPQIPDLTTDNLEAADFGTSFGLTDADNDFGFFLRPGLIITKTAGNAPDGDTEYVLSGANVVYTYEVVNTGTTYLVDITVTDNVLGVIGTIAGPVAPGVTNTLLATNLTVAADVTNVADASGNPTESDGTDIPVLADVTDSDDAVVDVVAPGLTLTKLADGAPDGTTNFVASGADVVYTYEVVNTGDTYLNDIAVTDNVLGVVGTITNQIAPGATNVLLATNLTVIADVTNIGFANGNPTDSGGADLPDLSNVTDSDDAVTEVGLADIGVFKSVNEATPDENQTITWTLVATNAGPDAATGVVITDSLPVGVTYLSDSSADYDNGTGLWNIGPLLAGASTSLTVDTTVDIGTGNTTITNTATVTAVAELDSNAANDTDEAVIDVVVPTLDIGDFVWDDLNFNGVQDGGEPGRSNVTVQLYSADTNLVAQTVTDGSGNYRFQDQAAGDYFLDFIAPPLFVFSPADQGGDDTKDSDADPATGRTAVFSLPSSNNFYSLDAGLYIPRGLSITKTSDAGATCVEPGDTITYTVTVENTGTVSHAAVTVTDPVPTGSTYVADSTVVVAPGIVTNVFSDEFNTAVYTNNDGNLIWSTAWVEEGDDGNPNDPLDGTVQIVADGLQTNVLQIVDKGRGVWREVDLTGYTNATLLYDYRRASLQPNESVLIYASANGTSSWNVVEELTGDTNDTAYLSSSIDITSYISTNAAIRFLSKGNLDFDDVVYFDNIRIEQTEFSLTATNAGGIPPTLAQGYTLETGNTLTVTYEVTVDQPSAVTQVVNTAAVSSDAQFPISATVTVCVDLVTVGDRVWFDAATNGVQDGGESGLPNVTVRLYDSATNLLETTLTDTNGLYSFGGWNPGDYFVEFVTPLGYSFANQDVGGDDTVDSDANPTTGRTPIFSLAAGAVDTTWDAGMFVPPSGVGDFVWLDVNTNGVQDVGEVGISNVTVRIYDSATNLVSTTVSEANGRYTLDSLLPNNYFVEFVPPSNYVFVAQDQGGDDELDSDADPVTGRTAVFSLGVNTNDFTRDAGLFVPPSSIGDFVWYDANTNGVQDGGEAGWTNLTVRLYDGTSNLLTTTATDTNGAYLFSELAPGSYFVEFVAPPNYGFTSPDQGADDSLDSDADPVTGRTSLFTIPSGTNVLTWDAALIVPPGGLVFNKDSGLDGACAQPGQRLTYTLTVTNTGNVTHTGIGISDPTPIGTTYVTDSTKVIAPVVSTGVFLDVFSSQTYTNNDGNLDWSGAWQEEPGDDGLPTAGDVLVDAAGYLSISKKTNGIYRLADLSAGYTNASLSLDFYRFSLDDADDYVAVYVSSNGAASWLELDRFEGPLLDEGSFVSTNYDISAYLAANTAVRFKSSDTLGNAEGVRFDNVRIQAAGFGVTNAGSAPPALTSGHTLAPGEVLTVTFQVDVNPSLSFTQVVANTATLSYDLQPAQQASVTDCVTIVSLGDFVWYDANTNGVQDTGEDGIPGVTVRLYDNSTNLLASTSSDSAGAYDFRDLTAGSYFLEFIEPSGYFLTAQDQGGDDTLDSDPDPVTGRTAIFPLATGETNHTYDAGMGLLPVDLSLTKSVDNLVPEETDPVTYTVTVANSGGATATGVEVTDLLPGGLRFDAAGVSQGVYDSTTGVWTVGTLTNGAFATLTIDGTVLGEANVVNVAEVTAADQPDVDSIPNNRILGEDDMAVVELTVSKCFEDGAYVIDMGQSPQTVANSLKPYGLLYDLVVSNNVTVYWSINPGKTNDGVDVTIDGKDYSGGPFIIPVEFVTTNILAVIDTWTNKGVVVDGPVVTNFCAPIRDVTYFPNAVLDLDNGSIAAGYYVNAEIPASSYELGTPDDLGPCDDIFTLPHADPTWAVHSNLLTFVEDGGFIWGACHAVSVLENVDDPNDADSDPDMNFLSVGGLVNFQTPGHEDGTPPYSYNTNAAGDHVMQFLGILDGATLNGSEQIYLPLTNGWRSSTTIAVWDPDHADVPGLSPGEAAVVAYGRAFGNLDYGMVMYEGGHSHDKNGDAEDVAAQRAYLNFVLLAGIRKRPEIAVSNLITTVESGDSMEFSANVSGGTPAFSYAWTSREGGTFTPSDGPVTRFTAPVVTEDTETIVTLTVTDDCGRRNFQNLLITLSPATGMVVEKTGNAFASAGSIINYELGLDYTNGVVSLDNARVVDLIPSNTTYVTNSANAGGTYDAGTNAVSWFLGTNMPAIDSAWFGSNTVVTLNPTQDTYIVEDKATENKGTESELKTKTDAGKVERALLKFDLSSVPPGVTVTSAVMRLNVTTAKSHTSAIYRLTQPWTETGATWNNYDATGAWASAGADFDGTSFGSLAPSQTGYTNVSIQGLVQGWVDGTWSNHGLLLDPVGPNGEAKYGSRENAGNEPELIIAYYNGATEVRLDATPLLISDSGTVTVTMSAEVSGTSTNVDVTAPTNLVVTTAGGTAYALDSGPTPSSPISVPLGGGTATFVYVYSVTAGTDPGWIQFEGAPTSSAPNIVFSNALAGSTLVVPLLTYQVQVVTNLAASVTQIVNVATFLDDSAFAPSNTVDSAPAVSAVVTLESYQSDYSTVTNLYYRDPSGSGQGTNVMYIGGTGYDTNTAYDVGYYDAQGTLVYTDTSATSDGTGELNSSNLNTNELVGYGMWTAVVVPDGSSMDVSLTAQLADLNTMASDEFEVRTWSVSEFTDAAGSPVAQYAMDDGTNTAYVTVSDLDQNVDAATIDTLSVTVTNLTTGDSETFTLYETGPDTGIFANNIGGTRYELPLSTSGGTSQDDGTLNVNPSGDTLRLLYTDGSDANDTSSDDAVTVLLTVDVGVTKSVSDASPNENDTIVYTLISTNGGPGTATGLVITDILPAGVTYVSDSSADYSNTNGLWTIGTLGAGVSTTLTISVTVDPGSAGTAITNVASVSALNEIELDPSNDTNEVVITIPLVDIGITKTVSGSSPDEGGSISYTVLVTNSGPDIASGLVVTDAVPVGVTYISDSSADYSNTNGLWTIGTLGINASTTLTINAVVDLFTGGTSITNVASVSALDMADSDPGNDSASAAITVGVFDPCDVCYLVADFGGGGGGDDLLTRFNKVTSVESSVGIGTGTSSIEAIAYDPFGTNLYAANSFRLGTIDLISGIYSNIGSFGTGTGAFGTQTIDDVDGLSLDPYSQVLYGSHRITAASSNDLLVAIDVSTGSIISNHFGAGLDYVVISAVSNLFDIDDIAIDAYDGQMYGVANNGASDRLVTINKATGAAADVGSLGVGDMEGLGFDNSGNLFGTTGGGATVYDISKTTGAASNPRPLTVGGDYESADCLTCEPNTITGTVFFDADESATFNVGDTGQSNAIVRLYRDVNTNGVLDLGTDILITSNVTDSAGAYQFTFASTGQFVLDIDTNSIPQIPDLTTDNLEAADFGTSFGLTDADNDFGFFLRPGLIITKTAGNAPDGDTEYVLSGANVVYTYEVVNTGTTYLVDIAVTDNVLGVIGTIAGPVAPGATNVLLATNLTVAADVTNIADANGNPTESDGTDIPVLADVTDSDDAVVDVVAPGLTLTKLADGAPDGTTNFVASGADVVYTYQVVNTGDTYLNDIAVTDNVLGVVGTITNQIAPGATNVLLATNLTVIADVTNIGFANGNPTDSGGADLPDLSNVTDSDDAVTELAAPAVTLIKLADSAADGTTNTVLSGANVVYSYEVVNAGDTYLSSITVTDDVLGVIGTIPGSVAPGVTNTLIATNIGVTAGVTNIGVVDANPTDSGGGDLPNLSNVSDTDDAITVLAAPAITLIKLADSAAEGATNKVLSGANVVYSYEVVNAGDTYLSSITVSDDVLGVIGTISGSVAPGATNVLLATNLNVTADVTNIGVVDANPTDSGGGDLPNLINVGDTNDAVTVLAVADVAVFKSGDPDPVVAGTTLTYTITVTNRGPENATSVSVQESLPAGVTLDSFTVSRGSYDTNTMVWTVGILTNNTGETLTLDVILDSDL